MVLSSGTAQELSEAPADTLAEDTIVMLQDDHPIAEALDSMYASMFYCGFEADLDSAMLNYYGFPWDSVPELDVEYIQEQLAYQDAETPFNLVYNKHTKGFIHLYAVRRRNLTARMLGLSHLYFPMIEAELDR